jgi:hypothetical protein
VEEEMTVEGCVCVCVSVCGGGGGGRGLRKRQWWLLRHV